MRGKILVDREYLETLEELLDMTTFEIHDQELVDKLERVKREMLDPEEKG